jgi:hypothetical protein
MLIETARDEGKRKRKKKIHKATPPGIGAIKWHDSGEQTEWEVELQVMTYRTEYITTIRLPYMDVLNYPTFCKRCLDQLSIEFLPEDLRPIDWLHEIYGSLKCIERIGSGNLSIDDLSMIYLCWPFRLKNVSDMVLLIDDGKIVEAEEGSGYPIEPHKLGEWREIESGVEIKIVLPLKTS